MKKALLYVCTQNLVFLLLLLLSGTFGGAFGEVLYYLAFLLPYLLTLALARGDRAAYKAPKIATSFKNLRYVIPIIIPTTQIIFIASFVSSLIFESQGADVSGNLGLVIITHVLITAILEEAFFRYLPLALLSPHSKKAAIFISAFFFAFLHLNFHQFVYAFVAGVIFATLDVVFDSIMPSVIIHFVNNLLSVLLLRYSENRLFFALYISVLSVLTLTSLVFIYARRRVYTGLIRKNLKDKR